ncbi:unknown protein [Microcystis aeruginosa NIES-298]|nr:unknown protein [Microcystis aeruginosa NIES-298]
MNLANLLTVGIASLTALAIALPNLKAQSPQSRSRVLTMARYLTIIRFENKGSIRQTNYDNIWFFVTWYGSIRGQKSAKSLFGKRLN